MRFLCKFLGAVLASCFCQGFVLETDEPTASITWPNEYHMSAETLWVTKGIFEPIEMWYSLEHQRSRIDYYGGTVKKYRYHDDNKTICFKVHPEKDMSMNPTIECMIYPDENADDNKKFKTFLPEVENFKYHGTTMGEIHRPHYDFSFDQSEETYKNQQVHVWKAIIKYIDMRKEETLYVYRSGEVDLPLMYEKKVLDGWLGILNTHTITNYFSYGLPDFDDLELGKTCVYAVELGKKIEKDLDFLHPAFPGDVHIAFKSFKAHHKKKFEGTEHDLRQDIFHSNWRFIVEENKKNLTYKLAINHFADLTPRELRHLTGAKPSLRQEGSAPFPHSEEELKTLAEDLPDYYDMRLNGFITAVKNQANCGSCWSFSSTAAVEGALARTNKRLIDLSEQSLVDCAGPYGTLGCDGGGGSADNAYRYILDFGIPSSEDYGLYLAEEGYCHIKNCTKVNKIKSYAKIPTYGENAMKVTLFNYAPVTIGFETTKSFFFYHSGVFCDYTCSKRINHGVTVVGYGTKDGATYWIVKNSWGENWGLDGYVLMSAGNDNCNALSEAFYPIV